MHEIILVKHRMKTPRSWLVPQQPPRQTAHKQLHYSLPCSDSHWELYGTSTQSEITHRLSSPGARSAGHTPHELQQGLQGQSPAKPTLPQALLPSWALGQALAMVILSKPTACTLRGQLLTPSTTENRPSMQCFGTPIFYGFSGFATTTTHNCTAAARHRLG